jgi:hypothetical protein
MSFGLMVFPTVLGRGKRVFPDGIDRLKPKLGGSRLIGPTASRSRPMSEPNREDERDIYPPPRRR